jgi:hypothetical protein
MLDVRNIATSICAVIALAMGCWSQDKPMLSHLPLSKEEVSVYRGLLFQFSSLHFRNLVKLKSQIEPWLALHNHSACLRQQPNGVIRQHHESAAKEASQSLVTILGLDGKTIYSAPSGRRRSIFLDFPFYRTGLPVTDSHIRMIRHQTHGECHASNDHEV